MFNLPNRLINSYFGMFMDLRRSVAEIRGVSGAFLLRPEGPPEPSSGGVRYLRSHLPEAGGCRRL